MPTVRSRRHLYRIPEILVTKVRDSQKVREPIIVKMKKAHADFLGLSPIPSNDPIFIGTFTSGPNAGKNYLRNIGGFRALSYTLVAKRKFKLITDTDDPKVKEETEWKSISIGFPVGATVHQVFKWINTLPMRDQVEKIITPKGRGIPYTPSSNNSTIRDSQQVSDI